MHARRAKGSLLAVVIAVLAAVIAIAVSVIAATAAGGTALRLVSHAGQQAGHRQAGRRPIAKAGPLRVLSVSPGNGAGQVNGAGPVQVAFSAALAPSSPQPVFSPAVAGSWHAGPAGTMVFTPATPFQPGTEVTLRIPAGPGGVRSATGSRLAAPVTEEFRIGPWSTLSMEQLLAELGYLPLSWTPATGFAWTGGYPSALTSQWQPGQSGVLLTGALMAFQSDHGLDMTGDASSALWQALFQAVAKDQVNPHGYSYALASQASPETLTIWHNGKLVLRSLANTGTSVTPTVVGTFPVYLRYRAQVMRGFMPDGSPYADPVQFVSYFNGSYAVHSFKRAAYGFPQSLGCVELPLSAAQQAWPYLTYGSLVTVSG